MSQAMFSKQVFVKYLIKLAQCQLLKLIAVLYSVGLGHVSFIFSLVLFDLLFPESEISHHIVSSWKKSCSSHLSGKHTKNSIKFMIGPLENGFWYRPLLSRRYGYLLQLNISLVVRFMQACSICKETLQMYLNGSFTVNNHALIFSLKDRWHVISNCICNKSRWLGKL